MKTSSDAGWADGFRMKIPPDVLEEIDLFVSRIENADSCLATGSIVEGIGNNNSDIDLYLIREEGSSRTNPISIGIRESRYVDCEHMDVASVVLLKEKFDAATVSRDSLLSFSLRDFDRYYRLAISASLKVSGRVRTLLEGFSAERSRLLFAGWSLMLADDYLARAKVSSAMGAPREAVTFLREAALWRATSLLAEGGEGYPSLKWVSVKTDRLFGKESQKYRDCLRGTSATLEDFDKTIAWLTANLTIPQELVEFNKCYEWGLGEGVTVVPGESWAHLILGKKSITRVSGVSHLIVKRLVEGSTWERALTDVAADLRVEPSDLLTAIRGVTSELADAGYLVPGGRKGIPHFNG